MATRRSELSTIESSVGQVAEQLDHALTLVRRLDSVLDANEKQQQRERRFFELKARLTDDEPLAASGQPLPQSCQDTLDAMRARIEGAVAALAIGGYRDGA